MSFFSTKNALAKMKFEGFGGIDTSKPAASSNNASKIENFRIMPDGSLKKRSCFYPWLDLGKNIRAVCRCFVDGKYVFYALAGNSVYKYEHSSCETYQIGTVGTHSGRASIFQYMGLVYVIDGREIYEIKHDSVYVVDGYAPLIGKNWPTNGHTGEMNEPLNLLNSRARISYAVNDYQAVMLAFPKGTVLIDALTINGTLVEPSKYYIDWDYLTVSISDMNKGDIIMLYITLNNSMVSRSELVKNTEAYVFGGISNSRVFLWGGSSKNVVFPSGCVSNLSLQESENIYSGTGGLYFPQDSSFVVGDGSYEIRGVGRHYDRLLIFTEGDTWMADSDVSSDLDFPTMRINTAWGCSSMGGVSKAGNDPISISYNRIMRWTTNTDELNDCNAYSISDEISSLLNNDFFKKAIVYEDKYNGELLFRNPSDTNGRVYVYNTSSSKWYTYTGINADIFFDGPEDLAFVSGSLVYFFDKKINRDKDEYGNTKAVNALYESNQLDFGMPERSKRFMGINLVGELGEGGVVETVIKNERETITKRFKGSRSYLIESFTSRIPSSRFRRGSIRVATSSDMPIRIFGLTVTVKP